MEVPVKKQGVIVITTIYNPSNAIRAYSRLLNHELIVVADLKTPSYWKCKNAIYLSLDDQTRLPYKLSNVLPFNHYSRKMIGYLYAKSRGAKFIIDTDDDNLPKSNWGFPTFEEKYDRIKNNLGFINIYKLFSKKKIWPRGLPLNLINSSFKAQFEIAKNPCKVGVWQGLVDGDPDVDAIYRLTNRTQSYFLKREPIVLSPGTISPFNSQNTIFRSELYPLLYLPTQVTFRFTDILRSLVAQPIMWLYDYQLGFTQSTVLQHRNPHNNIEDLISEIPMYVNVEKVINIVERSITSSKELTTNLILAYENLEREKIVSRNELKILDIWLQDLNTLI